MHHRRNRSVGPENEDCVNKVNTDGTRLSGGPAGVAGVAVRLVRREVDAGNRHQRTGGRGGKAILRKIVVIVRRIDANWHQHRLVGGLVYHLLLLLRLLVLRRSSRVERRRRGHVAGRLYLERQRLRRGKLLRYL